MHRSLVALVVLVALVLSVVVRGQSLSCDTEYGEHCPTEGGYAVGACLKKHQSALSKSCSDFIALHDACKSDIDAHCGGKEYTNDLQVCHPLPASGLPPSLPCSP